ncbi:MAG: DUF1292 domain-containing protein [Ruminococcaceae bacterium]|nr:DUF1292 domain-containing protein [Oscillospiraceae bacterium]
MKQFQPQEDEQIVVALTDENGVEVEMEILDTVLYRGKEYAILLPLEEEDSVVILSVEGSLEDGADCRFGEVDEGLLDDIFAMYEQQAAEREE